MWLSDNKGRLTHKDQKFDTVDAAVVAFQKHLSNTESALETDTAQRCAAVGKVIRETGIQIEDFAILP